MRRDAAASLTRCVCRTCPPADERAALQTACPDADQTLLFSCLQGSQEATNPPEAMAQPYTPAQYPPPPQNGIPAEFAAPHPLPTQDYAGQSRVPEHAMTLYTPTQTHSEPAGTDNSTPSITATTTAPVSVLHHLQTLFATSCQQVKITILPPPLPSPLCFPGLLLERGTLGTLAAGFSFSPLVLVGCVL